MNPPVTQELILERLCHVTSAYTAFVVSHDEDVQGRDTRRILNVEVSEVFKNEDVQLSRVLSPGYEGPHLAVGEEALIFAYTVPSKDYLEVRSCSVSAPLSDASKYLEAIRTAASNLDQHCSGSARDERAKILREQSDENMRLIRESQYRDFPESAEARTPEISER